MTSGEQKLALFADDLLISITQPTQTLPKLMKLLEEFGLISGYKININKSQVLTFNYDPHLQLRPCTTGIGMLSPLNIWVSHYLGTSRDYTTLTMAR